MALMSASATGLRSTLAMPGKASSSDEIWEPPSSAGMKKGGKGGGKLHVPPGGVKKGGRPRGRGRQDQGKYRFRIRRGGAVGKRGVREYRALEVLALIAADRAHEP